MAFNPDRCTLGASYLYADFINEGAWPSGWVLNPHAGLSSTFEQNGWKSTKIVDDTYLKWHSANHTTYMASLDWSQKWVAEFIVTDISEYMLVGLMNGFNPILTLQRNAGDNYTVGVIGIASIPVVIQSGLDITFRCDKYENGDTGSIVLTINGSVIYQGVSAVRLFGYPTYSVWLYALAQSNTNIGDSVTVGTNYLVFPTGILPSDCQGLVSASASTDRGIAPLGVQFTDTSEIA